MEKLSDHLLGIKRIDKPLEATVSRLGRALLHHVVIVLSEFKLGLGADFVEKARHVSGVPRIDWERYARFERQQANLHQ